MQWLTDPDRAPSRRDLADALRTIVADVGPVDGGLQVRAAVADRTDREEEVQ